MVLEIEASNVYMYVCVCVCGCISVAVSVCVCSGLYSKRALKSSGKLSYVITEGILDNWILKRFSIYNST